MSKIKAVIFDMDGVLVDSEPIYQKHLNNFFISEGIEIPVERLYKIIGGNRNSNIWTQILRDIKMPYSYEEMLERLSNWNKNINIDYSKILNYNVEKVLNKLKMLGMQIALASSTKMISIQKMLNQCNIRDYFSLVVSGEIFYESKPNPEIFLYTASCLNCSPRECIVIEDSTNGISAGKNANMIVVAKKDLRFNFDQSQADYIITEPDEVISIIEHLNKIQNQTINQLIIL